MMRAAAVLSAVAVAHASTSFANWPPEYCTHDLEEHAIPPLSGDTEGLTLVQVQAVARHGARIRYGPGFCWTGYDVTWNCDVTQVQTSIIGKPVAANTERLYNKVYDSGPNELIGSNCIAGNLMSEGIAQEESNGRHLRDAFIGTGPLHLFSSTDLSEVDLVSDIYLRSDDEERTVASGQSIFNGFFPPHETTSEAPQVVHWHTEDHSQDDININSAVCPSVTQALAAANASPEMAALQAQMEATGARVQPVMGDIDWDEALDCLATSSCSGYPMPVEDADATAITELVEQQWALQYRYNNAEYARLGMAKLWRGILNRARAAVAGQPTQKFSLIAGHDTTLMPMLAALGGDVWDGAWAGYASMLTLELYSRQADPGQGGPRPFFRMVYNGRELRLPGCEQALCSFHTLVSALSWLDDVTPERCGLANEQQEEEPMSLYNLDGTAKRLSGLKDSFSGSSSYLVACSLLVGVAVGAAAMVAVFSRADAASRRQAAAAQQTAAGRRASNSLGSSDDEAADLSVLLLDGGSPRSSYSYDGLSNNADAVEAL